MIQLFHFIIKEQTDKDKTRKHKEASVQVCVLWLPWKQGDGASQKVMNRLNTNISAEEGLSMETEGPAEVCRFLNEAPLQATPPDLFRSFDLPLRGGWRS